MGKINLGTIVVYENDFNNRKEIRSDNPLWNDAVEAQRSLGDPSTLYQRTVKYLTGKGHAVDLRSETMYAND